MSDTLSISNQLEPYIPEAAHVLVLDLLESKNVVLKIKNQRRTRHGDYRMLAKNKHQITINNNLNPYRFLITLIHEIAHLEAYIIHGTGINPHGKEWKQTFKMLMLPFLNPKIFPDSLLPLLAQHFKNPKASSDTDQKLTLALKKFDKSNDKTFIFEVPKGSSFKIYNGKTFTMGNKRVKRYEAIETKSGRLYLFNPNAEVELLNKDYNEF